MRKPSLALLLPLLAAACGSIDLPGMGGLSGPPVDLGLTAPHQAQVVADGLMNPSCVTFSPGGTLTVCDSGNGRVILVEKGGKVTEYASGFTTEYWKVDPKAGTQRFKLGPLSCVWLGTKKLAVTDAGLKDGQEVVRFLAGPSKASDPCCVTNSVGPTSDDPADLGEGNLSGMCRGPGGRSLYIAGQGADAKSWVLRADVTDLRLLTWASADDAGISVNSPMQCRMTPGGNVLVLYSGTGGKEDGLLVEWDRDTGGVVAQWELPGLVDPMGMDYVPGTNDLVVVDNNWSLTEVLQGKLARVKLPAGGGKAEVTVLGTKLRGPVSCEFGPDGRLYVAELGEQFDADKGRVVAISGF